MIWCLHGALGSHGDWGSLIGAPRLQLWAPQGVDLWREYPRLDYHAWAADWSASIAAQDSAPILLGYSMGGRLALHAALSAPIWRAVIIISAHTGLTSQSERIQRLATDQQWLERFHRASWPDFLRQWNQQTVFGGLAQAHPPLRHPAMTRCFQEWSLGKQGDLLAELKSIKCPVLWIVGEHDAKFRAIGELATAAIPSATLTIAPDCNHRVPWEWRHFVSTVAEWCSDHWATAGISLTV